MPSTDVKSLGQYCGHSVRRRQTDRFVVTENQFRAGLEIPLHRHRYAHFTAVLEGGFTETYANATLECPAGSLFTVPASEPHTDAVWSSGAHTLSVEISPKTIARMDDISPIFREARVFCDPRIGQKIEQLRCEFYSLDAISLFALEAVVLEILVLAGRNSRVPGPGEPSWMPDLMAQLHSEPSSNMGLAELAASVGVHEAHLARTFRRLHGCTVGEYVRWLRLDAAKRDLVSTDKAVATIAVDSGFYDQAHFSRAFKVAFGISPSAYRETFRSQRRT